MTKAAWKSVLLAVLVAISLMESLWLWRGLWQNTTEVGMGQVPTLPAAVQPDARTVTRPSRIVLAYARGTSRYVLVPSDLGYDDWLAQLKGLGLANLHPVAGLPAGPGETSVTFMFGVTLDHPSLLRWIPALRNTPLAVQAQVVQLYLPAGGHTVLLALESDAGDYVAATNLPANLFANAFRSSAWTARFSTWDDSDSGLVAAKDIEVTASRWRMTSANITPLVGSFFVNPAALTRIQENAQTTVWTDGSRIVRCDQGDGTLSYEEPNQSSAPRRRVPELAAVLGFVRTHGGVPEDTIVSEAENTTFLDTVKSFTFIPYDDGLPVLAEPFQYEADVDQEMVVRFRRPLRDMVKPLARWKVRILSGKALWPVIHRVAPSLQPHDIDVELGYAVRTHQRTNTADLIPAYFVSESGVLMWVLDAHTGRQIQGVFRS